MSSQRSTLAVAIAAMVVLSVVALPAVAAAETSLSVSVDQDRETGEAIVSVTQNGTAVQNASVAVNSSTNYSAPTATTDANGTVVLPAPNETVSVDFVVETNDSTTTETVTLAPLEKSLAVALEQATDEQATVTVTQYDEAVANATVLVETGENVSYDGSGEYQTGANGSVSLPVPASSTDVQVTATAGNLTAVTTATLSVSELSVSVSQDADGAVSIAVRDGEALVETGTVTVESENYTYAGSHDLENGTVSLPAPAENVSVSVTATVGNQTATTEATLQAPTDGNPNNDFAESLVQFIHFLQSEGTEGPMGQAIADFVHEHNPAAADDERGPPEHAGQGAANGTQGPAEDRDEDDENDNEDDRGGPPEHAGPNHDDDDRRGPPAHAGPNTADNGTADQDRDQDRVRDPDAHDDDRDEQDEADDEEVEDQDEADDEEVEDQDEAEPEDGDDEETAVEEDDEDDDEDDRRGPPAHAANGR